MPATAWDVDRMPRNTRSLLIRAFGLAGAALAALPAQAATGNGASAGGSAQARVLQPVSMTNTADMRFGQIIQPATSGTVTLSPSGTLTSAGGAAGNEAIIQTSGGPAPGQFTITAAPGTFFTIYGPILFNLSNGSSTMPVTLLTGTLQVTGLSANAITYRLRVGGTLSLAANQPTGTYSGSYTLQTVYQ
jgi:hypothetical protein